MAHVQYWFVRDARRFIRTTSAKFTSALARRTYTHWKIFAAPFPSPPPPDQIELERVGYKTYKANKPQPNYPGKRNAGAPERNDIRVFICFHGSAHVKKHTAREGHAYYMAYFIVLHVCHNARKKHTNNAKYGSTLEISDPLARFSSLWPLFSCSS